MATSMAPNTWEELLDANRRAARPGGGDGTVPIHAPMAAVLSCADARVSPARAFDVPAGSLFVVRVAGATATTEAVASLTYAVTALDVQTVIVLGHSDCGAVTAALAEDVDPSLEPLVTPIRPSLDTRCHEHTCAVPAHVLATVEVLRADPGPLGEKVRTGVVAVQGAVLDLATGLITRVSPAATSTGPSHPTPTTRRGSHP